MGRVKGRRVVKVPASQEGMQQYIQIIRDYKHDIKHLNDVFLRRLAEEGFKVATSCIVQAFPTMDEDKPIGTLNIFYDTQGYISSCRLKFTGQQVLFIEFGSGITYNQNNAHPQAPEFGYGVGTFPYQKHAYDPQGWSYLGEDDKWHHSKGTKATMPMFNATQAITEKFVAIAREVYQSVI